MRSGVMLSGALIMAAALAAGCAGSGKTTSQAAGPKITGTIMYLQRVALPAGALAHLRLEDVTRADAPATTIAAVTIASEGRNVPLPFELPYEASRIDPNHSYMVRATLDFGDGRVWRTTQGYRVLTRGSPRTNIEVIVEP
jgi:putative lipoprotein